MGKSLYRSLKSQKALWKILEMVSMPRIAKFLHFCMHLSNLFDGPSSIGAVVDVFRYCILWEIMLYSTKHHTLDFKWLHIGIRNHTTRELPKLSAQRCKKFAQECCCCCLGWYANEDWNHHRSFSRLVHHLREKSSSEVSFQLQKLYQRLEASIDDLCY